MYNAADCLCTINVLAMFLHYIVDSDVNVTVVDTTRRNFKNKKEKIFSSVAKKSHQNKKVDTPTPLNPR